MEHFHIYLKYFLYCQESAYTKEVQKWIIQNIWLENVEVSSEKSEEILKLKKAK